MFPNRVGGCGLDSSGSVQGLMVGSCEQGHAMISCGPGAKLLFGPLAQISVYSFTWFVDMSRTNFMYKFGDSKQGPRLRGPRCNAPPICTALLVNIVKRLQVPTKARNFLTCWVTISISRRTMESDNKDFP
jgi:hypothetical protein